MTAAADPDPRFRDTLAELREYMVEKAIDTLLASRQTAVEDLHVTPRQWANGLIDGCMSRIETLIAAEVRAQVQAAANQRTAEAEAALRYLAEIVQAAGLPGYTVEAVIHEAHLMSQPPNPQGDPE